MDAPPAMYLHKPPLYEVHENVMPRQQLMAFCNALGLSTEAKDGCGYVRDGICYVYRLDTKAAEAHFRAHCAGWKHK